MELIRSISEMTPTTDKLLALFGTISAAFVLSDISTLVGVIVGLLTICMLIPRIVLNLYEWQDARDKRRRRDKHEDTDSSDY